MISENIKNLRKEKGLTQKDLAERLHVTSQAVSRWEQGDVEPSIDTISNMAKIFEVTTDEIIGGPEKKPKPEVIKQVEEKIIIEQAKPVLTICEHCKRPIYNSEEIVTKRSHHGRNQATTSYICIDCDTKIKEDNLNNAIKHGASQRKKSFFWGAFISILVLIIGIIVAITQKLEAGPITLIVLFSIFTYTFVSCIFLQNNFIEDFFTSIASWGIVNFPTLLFSFSLEGFAWLIGMKILFWILGILLGIGAILLALLICLPLSAIVYSFALIKNINHPEFSENI